MAQILSGGAPPVAVPRFPLRVLGMLPSELLRVMSRVAPPQWRNVVFEMGCRPFDSQPAPAWRAFFGVFAQLERLVSAVFCRLFRIRGGACGVMDVSPNNSGDVDASGATVTLAMPPGLEA